LFHQVEHSTLKIIDALKYHAHKLSQPQKPGNLGKNSYAQCCLVRISSFVEAYRRPKINDLEDYLTKCTTPAKIPANTTNTKSSLSKALNTAAPPIHISEDRCSGFNLNKTAYALIGYRRL
jgi:hypothetical protein